MKYKRITLIDDDADDHEIFLRAIQAISDTIELTTYTNAKLALQDLIQNNISPEIIFLDLNMPVMTGQEFLLKIKSMYGLKEIPVIIFSTSTHQPTIKLMLDIGATGFITKPSNFNELIKRLEKVLLKAEIGS